MAALLAAADAALYRAKANGRNRVEGIEQPLPPATCPTLGPTARQDEPVVWDVDARAVPACVTQRAS